MKTQQYKELQILEQILLDRLCNEPFSKAVLAQLSKVQWKLSKYEQEPTHKLNQILH